MISLEQIRTLESKVHKAVSMLASVQEENQLLRDKLSAYESRIEELEYLIEEFKEDQSEIEQGIISALNHLDHLETAVGGLKGQDASAKPASPAAAAPEVASPAAEAAEPADAGWEVPAQVFEQPAAEEEEAVESAAPSPAAEEEEPEAEAEPARDQQLDIF